MSEVDRHSLTDREDPAAGPTWVIGLIGVLLLVVAILIIVAVMYRSLAMEFQRKMSAEAPQELEELRQKQTARLTGPPRWEIRPDSPEGGRSLVIPIDQAMQAMAAETASTSEEGEP
jgi:flagellar biosynthesis/type III secretory pathway M-ring protein FliF/YscJ